MTKVERLEYIRKRFKELETADAVLPATRFDIDDEVHLMDTYQAYEREKRSVKDTITSDES